MLTSRTLRMPLDVAAPLVCLDAPGVAEQLAAVEFARNVCNMHGAHTTEVDVATPYPIVDIIDEQKSILDNQDYGGTMRLGPVMPC